MNSPLNQTFVYVDVLSPPAINSISSSGMPSMRAMRRFCISLETNFACSPPPTASSMIGHMDSGLRICRECEVGVSIDGRFLVSDSVEVALLEARERPPRASGPCQSTGRSIRYFEASRKNSAMISESMSMTRPAGVNTTRCGSDTVYKGTAATFTILFGHRALEGPNDCRSPWPPSRRKSCPHFVLDRKVLYRTSCSGHHRN